MDEAPNRSNRAWTWVRVALLALISVSSNRPTLAQTETTETIAATPDASDGGRHFISHFEIEFASDDPSLPEPGEVLGAVLSLVKTPEGFVAPRGDRGPGVRLELSGLEGAGGAWLYDSALARIAPAVVIRLQELGLIGVYAEPDRSQFAVIGGKVVDGRASGDTSLRLVVTTGRVTQLRTTGIGDRVPENETVDNPLHDRIREKSPIQPAGSDAGVSVLRGDLIDDYVHFLNRHPGRRVDVAVAATGERPGAVLLDYLVTENRPWLMYAQVGNTGTKSTSVLRERFGYINNQLTNSDDVFSVEYLTANFSDLHALVTSYERPIFDDRLRGRVYGSWYTYTASDVGQPDANFDGDGYSIGAELIWNFLQVEDRFFDAVFGLRYDSVTVDNELAGITENERFVLGYAGVRYDHIGEAASTRASGMFEYSLDGADQQSANRLGRFDADETWVVLNLGVEQSMYLEPLLDPNLAENAALVHEVVLSARGQIAFDHRLVPNYEQVVGGLFTVRGYDEAIVAGDSVFVGSAEYRFHLPRSFAPEAQPSDFLGAPFRFSPQYKYGPVDWDLIFKGFVDVGVAVNSDRLSFERNNTLVGMGVGAELALSRHLNARLDVGWALQDAETTGGEIENEAGDMRLHFLVTVVF